MIPIPENPVTLTEFSEWNEYDSAQVPGVGGTSSALLDVAEMDGIRMIQPEGRVRQRATGREADGRQAIDPVCLD